MAILNPTRIANNLLGRLSQRIYHQDLMVLEAEGPRLKIDWLGAGDFVFLNSDPPGQNPTHEYTSKGLRITVERPADLNFIDKILGHQAAINTSNIALPKEFVLIATFVRPEKVSLIDPNQPPAAGTYEAAILLDFDDQETGVTSRFRTDILGRPFQDLNAPGLGLHTPITPIPDSQYKEVIATTNPSVFTVLLHLQRASTTIGYGRLLVGDELAPPAKTFDYSGVFPTLRAGTFFNNIRVGITTSPAGDNAPSPTNFRASVYLTEFEIWAPISGAHWMRAVHSHRYAHIDDPSTNHQLQQWDWDADDNQLFNFEPHTNPDTNEVYYFISVGSDSRLKDGGLIGGGNRQITLSWPVTGAENEKWKLIPANDPADGSFYIQSISSGYVMDVKGGSIKKEDPVILWHLSGFANQRWVLVPRRSAPVEGSPVDPLRSRA